MLNIKIICIGKIKEKFLKEAIEEYQKRLKPYCKFSILELNEYKTSQNPSTSEIHHTLEEEGKSILSKTSSNAFTCALCIEGKQFSSIELSKFIESTAIKGYSEIDFIIGGSFGLSNEVKKQSNFLFSMSKLTFPHQLARVILAEQIYRSFQISSGGKYHK